MLKPLSQIPQKLRASVSALANSESLKGRVLRGGAWLGGASFVEQVFRFGRNMLLTRLLVPEAFGTMAIVLSAASVIEVVLHMGIREALVQNPRGREEDYMRAAWWMALGRAASIYLLVYLLAPFFSRFYGNSDLTGLARVATLGVLFDGALSPRAIVAMKEMKFSKWAMVTYGGGICGVLITVMLSLYLRNVWALAIGYCSENGVRCILSFALCPWYPHLPLNRGALRELVRFSKGLFGLALLNIIFIRADIFVLGKIYPVAQLGFYSMAVLMVQTPATFLINVMFQTLLPAYSRIQNDHDRINRILIKGAGATALLGLPLLVFVAFYGQSLLTLVYGHAYGAGSIALALAAGTALFNMLNNQITVIFFSKALPQLHRRCNAVMAVVVLVLVYPAAKFLGVWGAQLACLIAIIIGYLLQLERLRKLTGLSLSEYRKAFAIPALVTLGVMVVLLLARSLGPQFRVVPSVTFGLVVCLIAYALSAAMLLRTSGGIVESKGADV